MDFISYDIFNLTQYNDKDDIFNYGNETIIKETNEIKSIEYVDRVEYVDSQSDIVEYPFNCYVSIKGYCYSMIYLLELISSNLRVLYIGSTNGRLKTRLSQHTGLLKRHKHHNKELQKYYNDFINEGSFEGIKINVIKKLNEYENRLEHEHKAVIDIATKYNDKFDTEGKKIKVIHSI